MSTLDSEFAIEKNTAPLVKQGRAMTNPNYFKLRNTIKKMEKSDGFTYPLNGETPWTVQSWVKKVEKELNDAILDKTVRDRNPYIINSVVIKDQLKKPVSIKIRRDQ